MSLKLTGITFRNFLSVGNITSAVRLDSNDLTLIIGKNADSPGETGRNGVGKAQPLTSSILTPNGWKLMGNIKINDKIIAADGNTCRVVGVFPQGIIPTYRFTFVDGRTCEASDEHLWSVFSHAFGTKTDVDNKRTMTTIEIIEFLKNKNPRQQKSYVYVPLMSPAMIADITLPVDPWLMGMMLGDGSFSNGSRGKGFSSSDEFIVNKANQISERDFQCSAKKRKGDNYDYTFKMIGQGKKHPMRLAFDALGLIGKLSHEKFIPNVYKEASVSQKLDLLQGLIDTDGYVSKTGCVQFTTVSEKLANDVAYIVRSIGGLARISVRGNRTYVNANGLRLPCKTSYTVIIRYKNPKSLVSLPRKKDRISDNYQYRNGLRLKIEKIERIEDVECQCIMIDHPSRLYVTDDFVVTHNTLLLQGISYVLFGEMIGKWAVDNIINNINKKNMLVSISFEKDKIKYRIERGRKPNIFKFYVNDKDAETEETKGNPDKTQADIEQVLGMNHLLFTHIIGMNTYTEPFLKMPAPQQRKLMEELFGISLLTHRDDHFKDLIKDSKKFIEIEEAKIKTIIDGNQRIDDAINRTRNDSIVWENARNVKLNSLIASLENLLAIDFDMELETLDEIEKHKNSMKSINLELDVVKRQIIDQNNLLFSKQRSVMVRQGNNIDSIIARLENDAISIQKVYDTSIDTEISLLENRINDNAVDIETYKTEIDALNIEKEHLVAHLESDEHFCTACGQKFHDDQQLQTAKEKVLTEITKIENSILKYQRNITSTHQSTAITKDGITQKTNDHQTKLKNADDRLLEIGTEIANLLVQKEQQDVLFEQEKLRVETELDEIKETVKLLREAESDLLEQINSSVMPHSYYRSKEEVWALRDKRDQLGRDLEIEESKVNPHEQNIQNLESTKQIVSHIKLNDLIDDLAHQEFIHKILSGKDSFVRKKIIDQNLYYLNTRTNNYLERMGLDHEVRYLSDLSVEISLNGNDYDFAQLSTGQRGRVILATAWAFRDIWENLNHSVNLLFIDELIDNGMDDLGAESALTILKQMSKERKRNIFLVSHKEFLVSRVNHTLLVHYESKFTRFEEDGGL